MSKQAEQNALGPTQTFPFTTATPTSQSLTRRSYRAGTVTVDVGMLLLGNNEGEWVRAKIMLSVKDRKS